MIGALVNGLFLIIGALAGSWWTNRHNDRIEKMHAENDRKRDEAARSYAQQEETVRQRLWTEVEFNQEKLKELRVRLFDRLGGTYEEMELTKRVRFLREKLPSWQRVVWEGQAAQLPLVLGEHAHSVNDFYSQLQDIQGYYDTLTANMPPHLVYNYDAWWPTYQGGQVAGGPQLENSSFRPEATDFLKRTNETWLRCEGIINTLNNQPNPVPVQLPL